MILDNADNAELFFRPSEPNVQVPPNTTLDTQNPLFNYLPSILNSQKLLLVTTKSGSLGHDLAHGESCVETTPFPNHEAEELLRSKLDGAGSSLDVLSTRRLLNILGYIPLAITQAAAFIKRNKWTIRCYLTALERNKQNLTDHLSQELQDSRRPRGFSNSVFRTWKLSFDQILAQEPQTAKLLSLVAMLDPQRIPEKLLRWMFEREIDFSMAIGTLDGFALISRESNAEMYAIHPLVQASVHYWLEQRSEKADYISQALRLLKNEFPNPEYENKEMCELLTHAQAVLCYNCVIEDDLVNRQILYIMLDIFIFCRVNMILRIKKCPRHIIFVKKYLKKL